MRRHAPEGPIPLFLFILIFANVVLTSGSVRAASPSMSLHMVGETGLQNGTAPVFVAGIWHQVTVNLTSFLNGGSLTLRFALPGALPASSANTYEWVRDEANDSWYDALYGTFLRRDLSQDRGTSVTFGVGVDALATPGPWSLEVLENNATILTETVDVEAPRISYGVSAADFTFQVNPFTPVVQTSEASGQYLRITNLGNVPLGTGVGFDVLTGNLSLANPVTVAHLGSDALYYLLLSVGPMPPQIVNVNGTTGVYVAETVPSSGGSVLVPSLQQTFHVTVTVGRLGYDLQVVGNVAFQTLDTVHAGYGSLVMWQVYLSGLQNVSLDVTVAGATLRGLLDGGTILDLPATLDLSGSRERALTIQVEADLPGTANVTFILHLLATGDTRTFVTTIPVDGGPAPPTPPGGTSLLWLAGAFATITIFGFVALGQLRHRTGRPRSSETRPAPGRGKAAAAGKQKEHGVKRNGTFQRLWTHRPGHDGKGKDG